MFSKIFFSKTEAGYVHKLFLNFQLIPASRSDTLSSYNKTCIRTSDTCALFLVKKDNLLEKLEIHFLPSSTYGRLCIICFQ